MCGYKVTASVSHPIQSQHRSKMLKWQMSVYPSCPCRHWMRALQDQDRKTTSKAVSTSQTDAEMADQDLAKLFVLTPSKSRPQQDGRSGHHITSALTDNLRAYDEVSLSLMMPVLSSLETSSCTCWGCSKQSRDRQLGMWVPSWGLTSRRLAK